MANVGSRALRPWFGLGLLLVLLVHEYNDFSCRLLRLLLPQFRAAKTVPVASNGISSKCISPLELDCAPPVHFLSLWPAHERAETLLDRHMVRLAPTRRERRYQVVYYQLSHAFLGHARWWPVRRRGDENDIEWVGAPVSIAPMGGGEEGRHWRVTRCGIKGDPWQGTNAVTAYLCA